MSWAIAKSLAPRKATEPTTTIRPLGRIARAVAVWFAVPGRAEAFELPHAAPLAELVAAVLEGGQLTVCTQCAKRRELTSDDLLPGARVAGAPAFTEEILADNAQAIVY